MSTALVKPVPAAAPTLITVNDVALILNCSARHVYRLADQAAMPAPRKLGALVRWSREEIERWIADGCPVQDE